VFDAVDLILGQADDLETIEARVDELAAAAGVDAERLFGWCAAFAAMSARELASQGNAAHARIQALLELAPAVVDAPQTDGLAFVNRPATAVSRSAARRRSCPPQGSAPFQPEMASTSRQKASTRALNSLGTSWKG
jgi:hypothetical protein